MPYRVTEIPLPPGSEVARKWQVKREGQPMPEAYVVLTHANPGRFGGPGTLICSCDATVCGHKAAVRADLDAAAQRAAS